jgi:hypothetical protein
VKLTDLEPHRLQGGGITFLCPRCRKQRIVAACPPWTQTGDDYATLSIAPSLNANPAHAHFTITNGKIEMSSDCKAECDGV